MKKIMLLPLLLVLLLTAACQKNDNDADVELSARDMIVGNWMRTSSVERFYNESNTLIHENSSQDEEIFFDFTKTTLTINPGSPEPYTATYSFPDNDRKNFMRLVGQDGNTAEYNITSISEDNMVWEIEAQNAGYNDGASGGIAHRAVYKYTFVKRTE